MNNFSWENTMNTMKKVSVQDFINANPKAQGQSKLTPFTDDILFLKKKGYTGKQILEFLAQNDVVISPNALNVFIRKSISSLSVPSHQAEPKSNEAVSLEPTNGSESKKGIRKFNWKNADTDGLI